MPAATTVAITAKNNATLAASLDLTDWAALYPLADGKFQMHMRQTADDLLPLLNWSTDIGNMSYDNNTNRLSFSSPEADVARFSGEYVIDCRFRYDDIVDVIFSGTLTFTSGVTRGSI